MGWWITAGYFLMMAVTFRVGFVYSMYQENHNRDRVFDLGDMMLVVMGAVLWPLTIVVVAFWMFGLLLLWPTKHERIKNKEKKLIQEQKEASDRQREYERNAAIVGVPPVLSGDTTAPDTPLLASHPYQGW
jgi:hypothetical protein